MNFRVVINKIRTAIRDLDGIFTRDLIFMPRVDAD